MSLPQRISAYDDCFEVFRRAHGNGARAAFKSQSEAHRFMMRMQQARALEREQSQRLYPRDDPRWGQSEHDKLQVKTPVEDTNGEWWVYVLPHGSEIIALEELDEPVITQYYGPRDLTITQTRQLEGPHGDDDLEPDLAG